jgi:hypothetical protein
MHPYFHSSLLYFYGTFLITCGIVSVIFIGIKAKTALASGGTSGVLALLIGYFGATLPQQALFAGIILSLALFTVFSWRSTKTLFKIFELIKASSHAELKGKGIAFLIISLMAVVSIVVLLLQLINL